MNDKYVKLADVKRKLRYIFKAYGVGSFVREKVERALNNLPYSVKGDLETTLKASDVQPVKHGTWHKDEQGYDVYVECSECGLNLSTSNYIENEWRDILKYCPNCGARMDGDN
jgi:hypothetical protein